MTTHYYVKFNRHGQDAAYYLLGECTLAEAHAVQLRLNGQKVHGQDWAEIGYVQVNIDLGLE